MCIEIKKYFKILIDVDDRNAGKRGSDYLYAILALSGMPEKNDPCGYLNYTESY